MRLVAPLPFLIIRASLGFHSARANKIINASAFAVSSSGSIHPSLSTTTTTTRTMNSSSSTTMASSSVSPDTTLVDQEYPGTAVERLLNVHERISQLTWDDLNDRWEQVRRKLLWAGGLRDLPDAEPGFGYTGHSFNDFNHVDLTCMLGQVSDNQNNGRVKGIAAGNHLGNGIRIASLPELGPGGSWSTCALGCNKNPPQDVAHVQFQSRIAFKLVWVPDENWDTFVLVDDAGKLLATGKPAISEGLPPLRERQLNYRLVEGSKYAREADRIAHHVAAE